MPELHHSLLGRLLHPHLCHDYDYVAPGEAVAIKQESYVSSRGCSTGTTLHQLTHGGLLRRYHVHVRERRPLMCLLEVSVTSSPSHAMMDRRSSLAKKNNTQRPQPALRTSSLQVGASACSSVQNGSIRPPPVLFALHCYGCMGETMMKAFKSPSDSHGENRSRAALSGLTTLRGSES